MAKKRIRLTHSSNQPGAEGERGDIVSCDEHIADVMVSYGGAEVVDTTSGKSKPARKSPSKPATAKQPEPDKVSDK